MVLPIRLTLLIILGVAGCQITPPKIIERDEDHTSSNLEFQIRRAEKNARSAEIASIFSAAANLLSTRNAKQQLRTFIARVKNDPNVFRRLTGNDRFELELIELELDYLDISSHQQQDLLSRSEALAPKNLAQEVLKLDLVARIQVSFEDHVGAVRALVRLSAYGSVREKQLAERIWSSVKKIPLGYAETLAGSANNEEEFAWWDLASRLLNPLTPALQQRGWDIWRAENPSHIAHEHPPLEISLPGNMPTTIALLLPQSGPLAEASRAIRDGFITAYWSAQLTDEIETNQKQNILIYDTSSNTIEDVVLRAEADGAQIILGPLSKANVRSMAALDTTVPTIVFNRIGPTHLEQPPIANTSNVQIPQFSLAVEDEVEEIARRITQERLTRIMVFVNEAPWSHRALAALSASLSKPAKIISLTTLTDLRNVTNDVGSALGIQESLMRESDIQRLFKRGIGFVPRRRNDIHVAVGLVGSTEYASLVAALDFHFGSDIPLFVTSTALRSDVPTKQKNGTEFVSIPLTLFPSSLRSELEIAFPNAEKHPSFYALGLDAYRLANQFERLIGGVSIPATTGNLRLSRDNSIRRVPAWGQITNNTQVARPLSTGNSD